MDRAWIGATLSFLVAATLVVSTASAADVKDVRLWRAPDHTRVVFDLTGPADHKLMVLSNPSRIVLDVEDTRLRTDFSDLKLDNTPIRQVRSGVRDGDDLRVVLDISAAVDPRSFALKANDQAGDRLVLDLYDKGTQASKPVVKKSATAAGKRDIIIAIDAGHGGEDPGALGPGKRREKDVVLAISKEIHRLFKADSGFTPTLIRSGDYYISLKGRRDLARKRKADLFVSIHADAFTRKEANGASVYALSTRGATSTAARYLAQRENAADLVGGVSLSDKDDMLAGVLADLSMTSTLDASLQVGSQVLGHMGGVARLHKKNVEQAGFAVLKSPDIPSILVETGFISNPGEAKKLSTPSYQKKMARAIHAGIKNYLIAHPPSGTLIAYNKAQGGAEYTIARGDTLSGIAQRFNVSLASLKSANGIDGSKIMVGQKLTIPAT
ncbi:N-acetylmuramoyl-L-alanine amidase [Halioglobus japonicus]|uniref:N-acetylmuramoyl-L-alanine amidase AmiC n=1 Tax=Halioglobus japonicus TaxID=930805 RepID=A0AAP8MBY9_9GAMM|nr:N-acetylmuramoyl-L-alanine amidase [Halioglobus japonicus]AQA16945.1 N-acetylmuramoyl-L-alanine amidase [Halioglobus japonicus]PLW84829.1 AMIN domain-containing protein [Halioglobus japonicus]GHD21615.1 N-acetylmuramoyl-L-alanine amidase [Halioglobus japonicus]